MVLISYILGSYHSMDEVASDVHARQWLLCLARQYARAALIDKNSSRDCNKLGIRDFYYSTDKQVPKRCHFGPCNILEATYESIFTSLQYNCTVAKLY